VLAGGIAHDFNNLLTGILGRSGLALSQVPKDTPAYKNIKQIEATTLMAAELSRQMLAYSGRGKFVVEAIHLSEVMNEMAHLLDVSIGKKCALKLNFAKELPVVEGDITQIRQVIMNLIINASEAIGEHSGAITVSTGTKYCDRDFLVESYLDDELPEGLYVYLEVSDTGSGMTPETQAKLFDPFFTTKFTGRGLGLAAVLGIVRGHQGTIKVYSEVGRGTTFRVFMPASKQSILPSEEEDEKTSETESFQDTGTILVVDDERTVRELTQEVFEDAGFTVLTASDGVEGVEVFRAHKDEISVVVLDLTMPRMDGEEAFREIRKIRKDARVILSSGYNELDATDRFSGKGLAGFIQKPYRVDELLKALHKAL